MKDKKPKKSKPIPIRLEQWELEALRKIADVEGLSQADVLRVCVHEGLRYFGNHSDKLANAFLRFVKSGRVMENDPRIPVETIFGWVESADIPVTNNPPVHPKTAARARAKSVARQTLHKKPIGA